MLSREVQRRNAEFILDLLASSITLEGSWLGRPRPLELFATASGMAFVRALTLSSTECPAIVE